MLKVVGANEWKTRLGSYILLSTCLICVLLVITASMEREELSGTYCSTVYWTPKAGFSIEFWGQRNDLENISKGVARACYKHSIMENGWSFLEIETQAEYPDRIQAFAAGMLEGALTWKPIYDHWSNTIESDCEKDDESHKFCAWAKDILNENYDNIKQEAEIKNRESHYWYQIWLFYYQMSGLEHGFQLGVRQSREDLEIPEEEFHLLNSISDWRDLQDYYSKFIDPAYNGGHRHKTGSMFVKLLPNNSDKILFGHSTDGPYSSMLRMHKHYYFRYHLSANIKSSIVPGTNISFTGYPGTLYSSDDFYVVANKGSNHFVIGGIRMEQENKTVWEEVVLDDSPILGARVMAANRLSLSGRSWCKYMSHRSATGVKQWLIVDTHHLYKNLSDENEIDGDMKLFNEGSVYVADQVPGKLHYKDVTGDLYRKGFWFSTGAPYIEETITMSNTNLSRHSEKQKFVEFYQQNVTTLLELAALFNRLGYRGDMDLEYPQFFGNIDIKLYSTTSTGAIEFLSKSGPCQKIENYSPPQALRSTKSANEEKEGFPVIKNQFTWSDDMSMQHDGQPETFDFDFVSPTWAWIS